MAPCPASAQLLQGTRAWGSTCSDPWSPIWPCSLLPKNIPAQMPSSVALAQPSTAQTPQSGASFLTWLLPKPFHNFCHVFLPHTPSFPCFSILLLLSPFGLQHFSLAALADVRKALTRSKNTTRTTQLPLPAHVPPWDFSLSPYFSPFSPLESLALTCGSQTGYSWLGNLSKWAPSHPPPWHPCVLATGKTIHGGSGTVPPPSLTSL